MQPVKTSKKDNPFQTNKSRSTYCLP